MHGPCGRQTISTIGFFGFDVTCGICAPVVCACPLFQQRIYRYHSQKERATERESARERERERDHRRECPGVHDTNFCFKCTTNTTAASNYYYYCLSGRSTQTHIRLPRFATLHRRVQGVGRGHNKNSELRRAPMPPKLIHLLL